MSAPVPREVPMYQTQQEKTPIIHVAAPAPYPYQEQLPYATQQPKKGSLCKSICYAITSPLRPLTYQLLFFHIINIILAVVSFAVVVALGALGIGMIPLFCLGILVLQVLLYAVHFFAQCDAYLYNCIAPPEEKITVKFEVPRHGLYSYSGYRISPDLSNFSKESLSAIFYFIFVKFPLAVALSSTILSLLATSIGLIAYPFLDQRYNFSERVGPWEHHHRVRFFGTIDIRTLRPEQVMAYGIALLYVTILFMHLFAVLLRATTKFFTCEFFATSGVVMAGRANSLPQYHATNAQYSAVPLVAQPTTIYGTPAEYSYVQVQQPRRNFFERFASKAAFVIALALLSFASMLFSIAMFVFIIIGLSLTFGLLPAACIGLLILQLIVWFIRPLAAVDGWLYSQRQRVYDELIRED